MANQRSKPFRETEWSRVYQVGPKSFVYESKFYEDNLTIDSDEMIKRWPTLSPLDRQDFVRSFQGKREFSSDDESFLNFLMTTRDEIILRMIAVTLCRHSDRERVTQFIFQRIEEATQDRANYYQAAEILGDNRFIPLLERQYRGHLEHERKTPAVTDPLAHLEILRLCKTLFTITNRREYEGVIRAALKHPSEIVRKRAKMYLSYNETEPETLGD